MQEALFSSQRSLPILAGYGNVTGQGMEMAEADLTCFLEPQTELC